LSSLKVLWSLGLFLDDLRLEEGDLDSSRKFTLRVSPILKDDSMFSLLFIEFWEECLEFFERDFDEFGVFLYL
jgi:hypothetical protein